MTLFVSSKTLTIVIDNSKVCLIIDDFFLSPIKFFTGLEILKRIIKYDNFDVYVLLRSNIIVKNKYSIIFNYLFFLITFKFKACHKSKVITKFFKYKNILSCTRNLFIFLLILKNRVLVTNSLENAIVLNFFKVNNFDYGILRGGGIVKKNICYLFKQGIINLHCAGELPKYRGIGSLEKALLDNENICINVHFINDKIDSGKEIKIFKINNLNVRCIHSLYARLHLFASLLLCRLIKTKPLSTDCTDLDDSYPICSLNSIPSLQIDTLVTKRFSK